MAKRTERRDPTEGRAGDHLDPEEQASAFLNRSQPGRRRPTKRKRDWERRQRKERGQVSYRGIPAELQERLKDIAQAHHVTVGEIARAFLEYGIEAYEAGDLPLKTHAITEKRTLYPDD